MAGQGCSTSQLLYAAAGGRLVAPEPGVLSSMLLSCCDHQAADGQVLKAAQICRVMLHAAAADKQLERLLLELQSAVTLSPDAVRQLLQAVQPQHRHQLAEVLLAMRDQHQDDLVGQPAGAAAHLIEQLQQLTVVDVLLLISLAAQQQWAADISLVLMHGVLEADSLQQLRSLYEGLACSAAGAADWLLHVGVTWASTCHLDLPQGFEEAGVRLLKAAAWSQPQLSSSTLQRMLQQLLAESAVNSNHWGVLQYVVHKCCHWHHQQQPSNLEWASAGSQHQQADAVVAGSHPGAAAASACAAAVAAACQEELLSGLTAVMQHVHKQGQHLSRLQATQLAAQYCSTISPLAAVSCDALSALLQCAVDAMHWQQQVQQLHPEHTAIKLEQLDSGVDCSRLTGSNRGSPASAAGSAGSKEPTGSSKRPAGLHDSQRVHKRARFSWGFSQQASQHAGNSPAVQEPEPCSRDGQDLHQADMMAESGFVQGSGGRPQQQQPRPDACAAAGLLPGAQDQQRQQQPGQQRRVQAAGKPSRLSSTGADPAAGHHPAPTIAAGHQHLSGTRRHLKPCIGATIHSTGAAMHVRQQLKVLQSLQANTHPAAAALPPLEALAVAATADSLSAGSLCCSVSCQQGLLVQLQVVLGGLSAQGLHQLFTRLHSSRQPWQTEPSVLQELAPCSCTKQQAAPGDSQQEQTHTLPQQYGSMEALWQQAVLLQLDTRLAAAAGGPGSGGGQPETGLLNVSTVILLQALAELPCAAAGSGVDAALQLQQLLARLLQELLQAPPAVMPAAGQPVSAEAAAAAVEARGSAVEQLLVRCHALSVLLVWLRQDAALAAAVARRLTSPVQPAAAPTPQGTTELTATPDSAPNAAPGSAGAPGETAGPDGQLALGATVVGMAELHAAGCPLNAAAEAAAVQLLQLQHQQLPVALQQLCQARELLASSTQQRDSWRIPDWLLQPPAVPLSVCVELLEQACADMQAVQRDRQALAGRHQNQQQHSGLGQHSRRHSSRQALLEQAGPVAAGTAGTAQLPGAAGSSGSPSPTGNTMSPAATQQADTARPLGDAATGVPGAAQVPPASATADDSSGGRNAAGHGCVASRRSFMSPSTTHDKFGQAVQQSRLAIAASLEAAEALLEGAGAGQLGRCRGHQGSCADTTPRQAGHCLHAAVLSLKLAEVAGVAPAGLSAGRSHPGAGVGPEHTLKGPQPAGNMQLSASYFAAAAELLRSWWRLHTLTCASVAAVTASNATSNSSLYEGATAASEKLLQVLLPATDSSCSSDGSKGSSRRRSGAGSAGPLGLSHRDVLRVLPSSLGPVGWQTACKLVQQEPLLGVLLALCCLVNQHLVRVEELQQEVAVAGVTPPRQVLVRAAAATTAAAAADTAASLHHPTVPAAVSHVGAAAAGAAELSACVTALVQLLAVLRSIAGGVYSAADITTPTDASSAGPAASQPADEGSGRCGLPGSQPSSTRRGTGAGPDKVQWLLDLLDDWLLELVLGPALDSCVSCGPQPCPSAPSHLLLLASCCKPQPSSTAAFNTCSNLFNVARLAHCLCLHHSPRVYLAADVRVWGRRGLQVGRGAPPAWVLAVSRDAAAATTRQALALLCQGLTDAAQLAAAAPEAGAGHAAVEASGQESRAGAEVGVGPAGCPGINAPPEVAGWACEQAAAVAALCSCVELLLAYRDTLARGTAAQAQNAQPKQQQQLPSCKGVCGDADELYIEAHLVFEALSVALAGPCCKGVAAMSAQLQTQQQALQQQQQEEEEEEAGQAGAQHHGMAALQQEQGQQQQQQQDESPSCDDAAPDAAAVSAAGTPLPDAVTAALVSSAAAAAAAVVGSGAAWSDASACPSSQKRGRPPRGSVGKVSKARMAQREAQAAQAAEAAQVLLCTVASLGCAVAQLAVRLFSPQHNRQQQQEMQQGTAATAAADNRSGSCASKHSSSGSGCWLAALQQQEDGCKLLGRLQENLRAFASSWQQLQHDLEAASSCSSSGAQQAELRNPSSAAGGDGSSMQECEQQPVQQLPAVSVVDVARILEQTVLQCRVQRRRDALAAVVAAAADANDGSETAAAAGAASPGGARQEAAAALAVRAKQKAAQQAAAAAAAAARFHDPDVREELPYMLGVLSSDDDDDEGDVIDAGPDAAPAPAVDAALHRIPAAAAAAGHAAAGARAFAAAESLQRTRPFSKLKRRQGGSSSRSTAEDVAEHSSQLELPGDEERHITDQQQQQRQQQPQCTAAWQQQLDSSVSLKPAGRAAAGRGGVGSPGIAAAALAAARHAAAAAQQARRLSLEAPARAAPEAEAAAAAAPLKQATTKQNTPRGCSGPCQDQQQGQQHRPAPSLQQQQQQDSCVVDVMCEKLSGVYDVARNMVQLQDGSWVTPSAFERLAGRGATKKWKQSLLAVLGEGQGTMRMEKWLAAHGQDATQPAQPQQQQQQQQRRHQQQPAAAKRRKLQHAPRQRQRQQGVDEEWIVDEGEEGVTGGEDAGGQEDEEEEQPGVAAAAAAAAAPAARNSFIAACLSEARRRGSQQGRRGKPAAGQAGRPAGQAAAGAAAVVAKVAAAGEASGRSQGSEGEEDEEEGDEEEDADEHDGSSDYSDLEDFIVCEPSTDYSKLLSKLGSKVSWRHCWRGAVGARRAQRQ